MPKYHSLGKRDHARRGSNALPLARFRHLSFLAAITVAMVLLNGSLLSRAYADETYTVYIGGTELTASADGTPSYYANGAGDAPGTLVGETDAHNAKLWYDAATGALTLELDSLVASGNSAYSLATANAGNAQIPDIKKCAGIYSETALALVLRGQSTVTGIEYDEDAGKGNSTAYGLYAKAGFRIDANSTGSLTVKTTDADGKCYAAYSEGNVELFGGTFNAQAGSGKGNASSRKFESYGIYTRGSLQIGGSDLDPHVEATAQPSGNETCGIYSLGQLTINSGKVDARAAATAEGLSGYSDAILANETTVTINGGTVTATSNGANGGDSSGITAKKLVVEDGEVRAAGGDNTTNGERSAGIYVNYDIDVNGGIVSGTGGRAMGGTSHGINTLLGNITIQGKSEVHAIGGAGAYSVGLGCERGNNQTKYEPLHCKTIIKDNAKVYASTDDSNETRVYSYGMFMGGGLIIQDDAHVESIAGRVSNEASVREGEKRSFGIYLGFATLGSLTDDMDCSESTDPVGEHHVFQITGGSVIAKSLDPDNGYLPLENGGSANHKHRSYAIAFYNTDRIEFSNDSQTNDKWYQWKLSEEGDFTPSSNAIYPYASNRYSQASYFHVEPVAAPCTVTFNSLGGTCVTPNPVQVQKGQQVGRPDDPAKEGFIFGGWYPSEDNGSTLADNPYDFETLITSNLTLYARWIKDGQTPDPEPSGPNHPDVSDPSNPDANQPDSIGENQNESRSEGANIQPEQNPKETVSPIAATGDAAIAHLTALGIAAAAALCAMALARQHAKTY